MRIKTTTNSFIDVKIIENELDILINYNLLELSSNNYVSIDRGVSTDRYSSTMKFTGKKAYIDSIIKELHLLRNAKLPILIDRCDESFFGDHINHSGILDVTLTSIGKQQSNNFNVFEVDVTFILNNPIYNIGYDLPNSLHCLQHKWSGYSDWDIHVNETYNRQNYFVDRTCDKYEFIGTYVLSNIENSNLLNYWKYQRGKSFNIDESQFGVVDMFGATAISTQHNVIIRDITYKRISSKHREVTIKLIKVSN